MRFLVMAVLLIICACHQDRPAVVVSGEYRVRIQNLLDKIQPNTTQTYADLGGLWTVTAKQNNIVLKSIQLSGKELNPLTSNHSFNFDANTGVGAIEFEASMQNDDCNLVSQPLGKDCNTCGDSNDFCDRINPDPNCSDSTTVRLKVVTQCTVTSRTVLWVANSVEGTASLVDTGGLMGTPKELGRFRTAPGPVSADPSRTSTLFDRGMALLANRDITTGVNRGLASVTLIAGRVADCVERNGIPGIQSALTAAQPTALPWRVGAPPDDECILGHLNLLDQMNPNNGSIPRAVAFSGHTSDTTGLPDEAYVGLFGTKELVRLRINIRAPFGAVLTEKTRIPLRSADGSKDLAPYGMAMDRSGNPWVVNAWSPRVVKVHVQDNDRVEFFDYTPPGISGACSYGMTIGCDGKVYLAGQGCLARLDPQEMDPQRRWVFQELIRPFVGNATGYLRGIAVDSKLGLWIADSHGHRLFALPAWNALATTLPLPNAFPIGAAIDADDFPWLIGNYSGKAHKFMQTMNPPMPLAAVSVGVGPYTYSDMSGRQLYLSSGASSYTTSFTGCGSATRWTRLRWRLSDVKGRVAALRARIGAEHKSLLSAGWDNLSVLPQDTTVNLARPNWQEAQQHLLQVEFRMQPALLESCPSAATIAEVQATYECGGS